MKLQANDIAVTLQGNPILQGVTVTAGAGELVGIIGPNGSGKSTLLRCIYRALSPQKGAVLLARALVQQTSCLILDEPTNHLDIQYQLELMDLVRGLGVTVLAAIHDLNIAALYCDRLYVMQQGQVVASGPPAQILTPERIAQVYRVNAQVLTLPGGRPYVIYQPGQKFQKNR